MTRYRVAVLTHTDCSSFPSGGITTYCREVLCHTPAPDTVCSIGVTVDRDLPLWKFSAYLHRPEVAFMAMHRTSRQRFANRRLPFKVWVLPQVLLRGWWILRQAECIYTHDIDMTLPVLAWRWVLRRRTRVVLTIHGHAGMTAHNRAHLYRFHWFKKLYWYCEDRAIRAVDVVAVVSREGYEYYAARYPHLIEKFEIVRPSVDVDTFVPLSPEKSREDLGLVGSGPIIGFVGRLAHQKDIELAIETFRRLKDVSSEARMVIVGDGDQRAAAEQHIRAIGLRDVTFMGEIDHSALPVIYSALDVLLLTSRWEGTPTTVLEALASGTPVVSTDVGGCREVITDGAGFVADSRDASELAGLLGSAIAGAASRERARMRSLDLSSQRRSQFLYELLVASGSPSGDRVRTTT